MFWPEMELKHEKSYCVGTFFVARKCYIAFPCFEAKMPRLSQRGARPCVLPSLTSSHYRPIMAELSNKLAANLPGTPKLLTVCHTLLHFLDSVHFKQSLPCKTLVINSYRPEKYSLFGNFVKLRSQNITQNIVTLANLV